MDTAQTASPPHNIAAAGWVLIGMRLVAMLILLILCVPMHFLWRLLGLGRFWPRIFLAGIAAIAGTRVRTQGPIFPCALLVSNHVSWIDILVLARVTGSAFVAHDGLTAFPFIKWLCEMNDTVFVARHDRSSVAEQAQQLRDAIAQAGTLTIFAEGTTSDGTGLLPIKSSLLSALIPQQGNTPIQPVLLLYQDAPKIAWVGDEGGLHNFLYILSRFKRVQLTVHLLDPLRGDALNDRKVAASEIRAKLLEKMG